MELMYLLTEHSLDSMFKNYFYFFFNAVQFFSLLSLKGYNYENNSF